MIEDDTHRISVCVIHTHRCHRGKRKNPAQNQAQNKFIPTKKWPV